MILTTNPLLQGLTRLRAQKLINYISARLRHCASHLTDRAEDIDRVPGLFAACWHQFKLDFNHGLLVYALVSLQYPETISAPAFLKSLHRLLVEGGIDSCDAVQRESNRHDPPYDDFGVPTSTAWWVDISGNSPPDTTPPNYPITHIINAFNREPDDAWPPWHLPVIVPQGWDSTKARPLEQSFEVLEKRLLTAETELRSAMEAIDVFRVDCRRFPPLLKLNLNRGSSWEVDVTPRGYTVTGWGSDWTPPNDDSWLDKWKGMSNPLSAISPSHFFFLLGALHSPKVQDDSRAIKESDPSQEQDTVPEYEDADDLEVSESDPMDDSTTALDRLET